MSIFAGSCHISKDVQRVLARCVDVPKGRFTLDYLEGISQLAGLRVTVAWGNSHPRRPTLIVLLQRSRGWARIGYFRPCEAGLVLRLPWHEVDTQNGSNNLRRVPGRASFQVSTQLESENTIAEAVCLTEQAIRRLEVRNNDSGRTHVL